MNEIKIETSLLPGDIEKIVRYHAGGGAEYADLGKGVGGAEVWEKTLRREDKKTVRL